MDHALRWPLKRSSNESHDMAVLRVEMTEPVYDKNENLKEIFTVLYVCIYQV